jgi:hypothetical protein
MTDVDLLAVFVLALIALLVVGAFWLALRGNS